MHGYKTSQSTKKCPFLQVSFKFFKVLQFTIFKLVSKFSKQNVYEISHLFLKKFVKCKKVFLLHHQAIKRTFCLRRKKYGNALQVVPSSWPSALFLGFSIS